MTYKIYMSCFTNIMCVHYFDWQSVIVIFLLQNIICALYYFSL